MENKKSTLIIILVIIIAILCCVIGWLLGSKFADLEDNTLNNSEENIDINQETEIIDLDAVANDLFSKISGLYMCGEQEFNLGNDNKLIYSELDKDYINRLVIGSLFIDKKIDNIEDYSSVSVDEFKNEFVKVFGSNAAFELPQTFYISYIKFDLVGDNYIGSTMAMGCESAFGEYYLENYEKVGNKINLYVYLLNSIGNNQYVLDSDISLPLEDDVETYTKEEILNNYKSEIIKYKYTFNIENDNYIFESIELAN